jgi:putative ABC transport system ATP-binding protein
MTRARPAESTDAKPAADDPPLRLRGVGRTYERGGETVHALRDVDLTVEAGEFVAVVGPSGSGKSTMLNTLGLLDTPTAGDVFLDGEEVSDLDDGTRTDLRKEYIGFVFQDFYLIPTLTATENVLLPTVYDADREAEERAADLLRRVGLGDRLGHRPTELSGGQKQRVAIARSLVNEPEVLLADEPTGNLDTGTGRQVLEEFERVCAEGVAVVAVTHDELVTEYADRTVELVDGHLEGR